MKKSQSRDWYDAHYQMSDLHSPLQSECLLITVPFVFGPQFDFVLSGSGKTTVLICLPTSGPSGFEGEQGLWRSLGLLLNGSPLSAGALKRLHWQTRWIFYPFQKGLFFSVFFSGFCCSSLLLILDLIPSAWGVFSFSPPNLSSQVVSKRVLTSANLYISWFIQSFT